MSERTLGRFVVVEALDWEHPVAACLARDPTLGRLVTLRHVTQAAEGLRREAMAPAHVDHPGIATLHEVVRQGDTLIVVFEHVGGVPLARWLSSRRRAPEMRAQCVAAARIIHAIHAAGVVHGDLRASSIVIDPHRRPWVIDLGLAGVVADRTSLRTPAYDQRAFARIWLERIAAKAMPIPGAMRAALLRAADDDASRQWPSMAALADAIARKPRGRAWLLAALALAALAGGGAYVATRGRDRPDRTTGDRAVPAVASRSIGPDVGCSDWPMFSDARTLVFAQRGGLPDGVYALDVTAPASVPRFIEDGPGPEMALQRDGRDGHILYMRGADVVSLDVAAGTSAVLPRRFDWFLNPFVAGDAAGGLFHVGMAGRGFYVHRDGQARALATVPPGEVIMHLALSPDRTLAVLSGTRGLYLVDVNAATAEPVTLTALPAGGVAYQRAAVTDARVVYYPRRDGIARLDAVRGTDELLAPGAVAPGGVALSPDGRTLVWSECRMRASVSERGDVTRELFAESLSWPSVGSDGSLLFTLDLPSGAVAARRTPDGRILQLSTQELGTALTPAMSPDGTQVAFTIDGASAGVHVAPADGSAPARLVAAGGVHYPMWLPDGRLAFARPDETGTPRLYAIPAGGGDPVIIHPRSRRLADVIAATGEVVLVDGGFQNLWRWNPATGVETAVPLPEELRLTALAVVRASPDGATALVTPGMFDAIWRIDLRGKAPAERLHQGDVATVAGAVYTLTGSMLFMLNTAAGGMRAASLASDPR